MALEVLRWVTALLYTAVAVDGIRLWRRQRSSPAAWVALAFTALAAAILVNLVLPDRASGPLDAVRVLVVLALVSFPYLLYRFSEALRPGSDRFRSVLTGWTGVVLVVTALAAPRLGTVEQADPAWYLPFLVLVLSYWSGLAGLVAVRLWRAGSGQPTPARRRMRLLAAASVTLNLALLLAGTAQDAMWAGVVTQIIAGASAALFAVGFSPPAPLRALWRRPEGRELRSAERGLMAANSGAEIAAGLLPPLARLLGGEAAALYAADGRLLGAQGDPPALPGPPRDAELPSVELVDNRLVLQFEHGAVVVHTSVYTPLFGADEVALAHSLAALIDLALARVDLLDRERRTWAELERTNEELQTLVYGISHDLRNPLLTMLGYVDLLGQGHGGELNADGRMFVERLERSSHYMDSLIRDLLELSRVGRVHTEVEEVDLTRVVGEVAEDVQGANPGLSVEAGPVGRVVMSPVRARQLFTNLLQNAARHGGKEDLRVRVHGDTDEHGALVVSVADDGVGVPAEYRERLFRMFERLEGGSGSGTGIGLAICKRIMENLGGSICLADADEGTDVRLTFPQGTVRGHAAMETNA